MSEGEKIIGASVPKDEILTQIKQATSLAFFRIIIFGIILIATLTAVYFIITDPDFLHSALSFKTISDDEGVERLVAYSNEISSLNKQKDEQNNILKNAMESKKNVASNSNEEVIKMILDSGTYIKIEEADLPSSKLLNQLDLSSANSNFPIPIYLSYDSFTQAYPNYAEDDLLFTGKIEFSGEVLYLIVNNINNFYQIDNNPKMLSEIQKYLEIKGEVPNIIEKFREFIERDIVKIENTITNITNSLKSTNEKMLATIKRLRSDKYIYASVVLQKVMITLLIVSIGLYFLKAIGADLLFIRKLTIINLSQSIAKNNNGTSPQHSVTVYSALASDEEKLGKAPDTIAVRTLEEIAKLIK